MSPAIRTLLSNAFDDAGKALQTYERHRKHSWLGSFCCSTDDLANLPKGVPVAAIGQEGSWDDAREADARLLTAYEQAGGEIVSYELPLADIARLPDLRGFASVDLFVELPANVASAEALAVLAESEFAFAKARIDRPDRLAAFLHDCLALDLPFKLAADAEPVRLLASVALAYAEDLSQRELQQVLEADPTQWRFGAETVACFAFEAGLEDIEASRDLLRSIEVASLDGPLKELKALGLVGGDEP